MPDYGNLSEIFSAPEASPAPDNWPPEASPAQWFALVVKPRCDKAVARSLEMKGYETFLPLYRKPHKYGTRSKDSELPLFPGYVFCRFDPRTRLPILITPGVTQILGTGSTPTPLDDREMFSLRTAIDAQLPVQLFPFLRVGHKVRINRGVLAGVEGIVVNFKQYLRLVLSITLLRRSVLLEVDRDLVCLERGLGLAA